jgi:hypothetical protein
MAVAIAIGLVALPEVVRRVAISKIRAGTGRDVAIDNVDLNLFTSRLAVKGFRLADRERTDPFVQFDQLNARIRLLPLLTGHVRIAELSLSADPPSFRLPPVCPEAELSTRAAFFEWRLSALTYASCSGASISPRTKSISRLLPRCRGMLMRT